VTRSKRASGRAHVVVGDRDGKLIATITVQRGNEIDLAYAAMKAAGFKIVSQRARALTVLVGRKRLATITKALHAAGFEVAK
jgi:hypothetical protein